MGHGRVRWGTTWVTSEPAGPLGDDMGDVGTGWVTALVDRRTFLRRLATVGVGLPVASLVGCTAPDQPRADRAAPSRLPDPNVASLTRPTLIPWGDDAVLIDSPGPTRPMAYVSRGRRRIWVDPAHREQVYWMLAAHISVSSGLWRIHLPGDDTRVPITPGDTTREFEEFRIDQWDPAMRTTEGDFRIVTGNPVSVAVDFDCAAVVGSEDECSAGPWSIARCSGAQASGVPGQRRGAAYGGARVEGRGEGPDEGCREDLGAIGTGVRHARGACSEAGRPVRVLAWTILTG